MIHDCFCADKDDDEEEEEDEPKTKTVKETVWDWDLLNDNKALWLRSPSDVSEDEYLKFYKALAKVGALHATRAIFHTCRILIPIASLCLCASWTSLHGLPLFGRRTTCLQSGCEAVLRD